MAVLNAQDKDKLVTIQFQKDKNLGNKIKVWAPVFMSMLVERAYKTHGLVGDCSVVMAKSQSYRNTQDCFSEFISERIVAEEGQRITQTTLKAEFKDWYELQYGGKVPRGKDLFDYIKIVHWGHIPEFDLLINATSLGLNEIDEINLDFQEQLKLDSPFFKELSDIWAEQIDKGVRKLPKFHWEKSE